MQKKHRWDYYEQTYDLPVATPGELPIIKESAIRGARHLVSETDLRCFISIIPGWDQLSNGLHGLVLGTGDDDCYGWHDVGVICVHAWRTPIEESWQPGFYAEHREVLERLTVPVEYDEPSGRYLIGFTKKTAMGFLLMHIFLHELGHHHDRMQTRSRLHAPGEEDFAETFSHEVAATMWPEFYRLFGY